MLDDSRFMIPLQLAGQLIMENGGETYRVEDTISRMGHAFGLKDVDSFAIPSGIFISYRKSDGSLETAVKRVRRGPTNLTRVDEVNAVSRLLESDNLSCEDVLEKLEAIAQRPPLVSPWILVLVVAISSGGWAVMFGGGKWDFWDFACGIAAGALIQAFTTLLDQLRMKSLVSTLAGSFLAALFPMFFHHLTGLGTVEMIVAGTLMPMLPGVAMTNAVQDAMRGDMVSAISHAINALLTAALIAGGALAASWIFSLLMGGGLL